MVGKMRYLSDLPGLMYLSTTRHGRVVILQSSTHNNPKRFTSPNSHTLPLNNTELNAYTSLES